MFCLVLVFIFAVATTTSGLQVEKIVGGKIVPIQNHPYQISLQVESQHMCGASLIKRDVVLTASHCLNYWPAGYSVRAGSNTTVEGGQVAQVIDVCSHSKYDNITFDYDVSVLKLNKPLNLNSDVQLITLQNVGEEVETNTLATVTGWGARKWEGETPTKYLRKVEVPKIDQKKCQEMLYNVTDRMTCYGYINGGKDSCQGDSGGPLVVNGTQVGIVSWGHGCAWSNSPGVYTRLENEEIHHHINNCLAKFD